MPTYEYRCTKCGHDFETFQKFSDEPLTVCPKCGAELRKVFNSVGVVFKGSGFYSTDNGSHKKGKKAESSLPPAKAEAAALDKKTDAGTSPSSKTSAANPSSATD